MKTRERPGVRAVIAALGVLALAALIAACGSSGSSSSSGSTEASSSDGGSSTTASASCTPKHEFETIKEGVLTVVGEEYPPFLDFEGGEPSGVEAEILEEIAKKECLELDLTEVQQAAVIPSVESGRADAAAGDWYRTKERAEVVNQTYPIYLDQVALVSKEGYSDPAELEGLSVGTVQGTLWNKELEEVYGDNVKIYQSWSQLWSDLEVGRVDVAFGTVAQASLSVAEGNTEIKVEIAEKDSRIPSTVKPGQTNFPQTKGNEAMTEAFDADLEEMHEDGTIARILKKNGVNPAIAETGKPYLL